MLMYAVLGVTTVAFVVMVVAKWRALRRSRPAAPVFDRSLLEFLLVFAFVGAGWIASQRLDHGIALSGIAQRMKCHSYPRRLDGKRERP